MTKGLNIVSRLTFENIPDGTLPTSIPDENQYSSYSYTKNGTVTVETIDDIKFIKLNSSTAKIYSPSIITDQSKKNFQAEFDIIFDYLKADTHLVSIGTTSLANSLRVVASNNPVRGLRLINGDNQISSYYRFVHNKKYTICVGFKDNVISMYVNGTIIGYFYSEEFVNSLNITTPSNIILGAPLNSTNNSDLTLYGKLGNINISSGPTVKHEESYTKYGTNLVSFLNFENLAAVGTYKTGIEAVYEGIEWRGVESATYTNRYGNIKNISTDLTGEFTVTFSLKKFKIANANILKYGNYSVDYAAGFIPVPEPDVEVNEYTTAALNFENGLVDQIGTTVWQKEGTADVTSVNKIFGENSFETKALGDSLSTTSNIITGGATPFTIEFYALLKGENHGSETETQYPLLQKSNNTAHGHQLFNILDSGRLSYRIGNNMPSSSTGSTTYIGSYKNKLNEINKYTITYDGSALRCFINDKLDILLGRNNGFYPTTSLPLTFFREYITPSTTYYKQTYGLIDNINIHDGIATRVRDPDPYEEFLVVDLAFDGENNSNRIVDNCTKPYAHLMTLYYPFNNSSYDGSVTGTITIQNDTSIFGDSCAYFNSGYITHASSEKFNLSSKDFTIKAWVKFDSSYSNSQLYPSIIAKRYSGTDWDWGIEANMNNKAIYFVYNKQQIVVIGSITLDTWMHICVTCKNGVLRTFCNGSLVNTANLTGVISHTGANVLVGRTSTSWSDNYYKGHMKDLILINGYCEYTSSFDLPTSSEIINRWLIKGNAKISTDQKFDGFSSLHLDGGSSIYTQNTDNHVSFNRNSIFTLTFDYICTVANTSTKVLVQFFNSSSNRISLYMHSLKNLKLYYSGVLRFDINVPTIEVDTPVNYRFIWDKGTIYLYINNVLVHSYYEDYDMLDGYPFRIYLGESGSSSEFFHGYIKNFKIYKGVAVIPEDPTGKIQLDFDNNFNDKYGNSTWTNNGVTFDQVNSVKGHAAKFNGSNSILSISNNQNLNFENKNFVLSYDFKNAIFDSVNNRYLLGNGMAIAHGAFWRLFGTSSSKSGSFNLNYNSANYGLTNTVEVENNYYNEKILRNSDTLVGFKNDVAISALNVINTFNVDFKNMSIGTASSLTAGVSYFNGYIDNFKSYKEDLLSDVVCYPVNNTNITTKTDIINDSLRVTFSGTTYDPSWYTTHFSHSPRLKNFTAEIELFVSTLANYNGLLFRSADYSVNNPRMCGYYVITNGSNLQMYKGTNSSNATSTNLASVTLPLKDDNYHVIKVVARDSNFKVYFDDIFMFEVNDSTHTIASDFASPCNWYNANIQPITRRLDIYDENDNHVYHKDFKSKIENQIDRPAVHLPLETNAINTGFAPLTINSVGNPTYTTIDGKKCIKFESGKHLSINSNNIFNLGTNSDFYMEFDIWQNSFAASNNYPNILASRVDNNTNGGFYIMLTGNGTTTTNTAKVRIRSSYIDNYNYYALYEINLKEWNNIKFYRISDKLYISINGKVTVFQNTDINLSMNETILGGNPVYNNYYFDGYISNFKMFVCTSQPPETYNDKKVLDLDFKPTGKSYLFKDNNNKCVIHPVNITQRDYQDSQYCCTFNGTNQYLQLGKNDLFNFGLDDFVINIKFKLSEKPIHNIIILNNNTSDTKNRSYISINGQNNSSPFKLEFGITNTSSVYYQVRSNNDIQPNVIYDFKIISSNGNISMILNDEIQTMTLNNINNVNFNYNDNTYICNSFGTDLFFKGTIYSIKVLRNTTDLSLLEDENVDVIAGDTTLTLSNGTDSQEVIFDNKDQNDFRFVHSNDSTKLIVNDEILEVPNAESESTELSLFTDFNAEVKDVKTYNIAFEDEDTFSGNVPIHTQFGEIEEINTLSDEFFVVDQGDFVVKGFFEGRPEDSRYQIQNRFDKFIVHTGVGPFNYNGLNERFIDDYEIYLPDTKETMPIPTEPMIRGYINITVELSECTMADFAVKVTNTSNNKLIGIYEFNGNLCTIPNLDCNQRYDCLIFDRNVIIESRSLSNRTPLPY